MSQISEEAARALSGIVARTEEKWTEVQGQYSRALNMLVKLSRQLIFWVTPFAFLALVLGGGVSAAPPVATALIYAAYTIIAELALLYYFMRPVWNIGIGDWTVRRLTDALRGGRTEGWSNEVRKAVVGLRRGIRNVVAIGLIPVLAATWVLGADPYHQWLPLFGVMAACLVAIVGFVSPPEGASRGLLLFLAVVLTIGSGVGSALLNPYSWWNQWQEEQRIEQFLSTSTTTTFVPNCWDNPPWEMVANETGFAQYEIGPIVDGCRTGLQTFVEWGWTDMRLAVSNGRSTATIEYNGGPIATLTCRHGGGDQNPGYSEFWIIGGHGYLTVWTWDSALHPGPLPGHACY